MIMMPPPNVTAHAAHGARAQQHRPGRAGPLRADAGPGHTLASRHRPRRHRDPERGGEAARQEGKTRFDLGREEFESGSGRYVGRPATPSCEQLRAIGASCDWRRTYFTLDEDLSRAVREVFVRLYEKGLIYRGKYIINWCPRCLTALSNEEAEKEEMDGKLWRLRYPLEDGSGFITVATTRPETMLGDTGVAVHPEDERYATLVGRTVRPAARRTGAIPIVADDAVDPSSAPAP